MPADVRRLALAFARTFGDQPYDDRRRLLNNRNGLSGRIEYPDKLHLFEKHKWANGKP